MSTEETAEVVVPKTFVRVSSPGLLVEVNQKTNGRYDITGFDTHKNPNSFDSGGYQVSYSRAVLVFQSKRPTAIEVSDGITEDVLLAVIEHRLKAYNNSLACCRANSEALLHIQLARGLLSQRGFGRD